MKNALSALLTLSILLFSLLALTACTPEQTPIEEHEHTYGSRYFYDDIFHWRECTNEDCLENSEEEEHSLIDGKCFCGYTEEYEEDDDHIDEDEESGLEFVLCDNSYYMVAGIGTFEGENVVVPATYKGLPVTAIGECAFQQEAIKSISLPECITTIGESAFSMCTSLTTVTLPTTAEVTSIGSYAFYDCTALSAYTLSNSLVSIGDYAFCNCDIFDVIALPENLSYVGFAAFKGCNSVKKVIVPYIGPTTEYDEEKSFFGYILGAKNPWHQELILPESLTEVTVYGEMTTLPLYSFKDCKYLKKITLPAGLQTIGPAAFEGCSSLEELELPRTVTSIERGAFSGCTNLTLLEIAHLNLSCINEYTFYECSSLESIVLPVMITSIGNSAFKGCCALEEIVIPYDVTEIQDYAFANCTGLGEILIHENILTIGNGAFENCTALGRVTWNAINAQNDQKGAPIFFGCTALHTLYIDENVASLPDVTVPNLITLYWNAKNCTFSGSTYYGYFANSETLTTVIFGENVMSFPSRLFHYCTALENVTLPPQLKILPDYTFIGCENLTSITFPEGLEEIGACAFFNCKRLASVTFPTSIKKIDIDALYACESLESIEIPEGLIYIGNGAFYNCTNLTSVTWLARACADPEKSVFSHFELDQATQITSTNSYLTSITIGENVQRIPANLFFLCNKVSELIIPDSVTQIGDRAFKYCASISNFYLSQNVQSIGAYAFEQCLGIQTLSLPDTLTSIGEGAFYECYGLKNVQLPTTLTSIPNHLFYDCSSLLEITVPEGVVTIERDAFCGCTELRQVTLPSTLRTISDSVFGTCENLTQIDIPHGVTEIGDSVFLGCKRLTKILIPTTVQRIGGYGFLPYYCPGRIVFCKGSQASFERVTGLNEYFWTQDAYYYSATKPETAGNYWHYDDNGNPVIWEFENL